ncbi:ATP-binding protein [Saccharothrix sp. HUAS TT1]|uniref:ATP-binding protein n=1 Tax=unclassified Saccharothrix TaxID=2593673 RepID=UPI00345B9DC5
MTALTIDRTDVDGAAVVRPTGKLDLTTYRQLRDELLKCAVDEPTAVIVRLDAAFECATPALLSVFAMVWLRVAEWPGIPVMLVAEPAHHRALTTSSATSVPRFRTLDTALAAVERPPECRHDETRLPGTTKSGLLARNFVRAACERWRVTDLVHNALTVATELVENAVRHAHSAPLLRLELRGHRLTIAVCDDSPEPPAEPEQRGGRPRRSRQSPGEPRKPQSRRPGGWGMSIVASLSRTWGCYPWRRGGKVVWAILGD